MRTWTIKWNNGNLAILCSKCSKIIKEGKDFTKKELEAVEKSISLPAYYCEDCKIKLCKRCNTVKSIKSFCKSAKSKDGHIYICKQCELDYRRTIPGLITQIYKHHKWRIEERGIPLSYTKTQLKEWLFKTDNFLILYNNWKNSNYNKNLIPSVDRINDYLGYSLNNIQLLTWEENFKKSHIDKIEGRNTKISVSVCQYTKDRKTLIKIFPSLHQANRETQVCWQNIYKVCKGLRNTAGGYWWKYNKT